MRDLLEKLRKLEEKPKMIPTREECLRLMGRYGMLDNIVDHSLKVTQMALFLSKELNKKNQQIDLRLVEAASLLHDIAKTICFETKEDHAQAGGQLLKEMGYEKVGEVVAKHVQLSEGKDPSIVSEEEIVNYADKRVQHDRIVSLEERFRDLKERYGRDHKALEKFRQLEKVAFAIENKIFSILGSDPNDSQLLQVEKESTDGNITQ